MKKAETIVEIACIALSGVAFVRFVYEIIESSNQCAYNRGYKEGYDYDHCRRYWYWNGYSACNDWWCDMQNKHYKDAAYWRKKYEEEFYNNRRES